MKAIKSFCFSKNEKLISKQSVGRLEWIPKPKFILTGGVETQIISWKS